jgi:hypothetical protein
MSSNARSRLLSIAAVALAVAKLFLSADEDVVARVYSSEQYAARTLEVWGGDFTPPVGFPAVSNLLYQLGIPYRVAIDLIYLAACWFVARALLRATGSLLVSLIALSALALHPWPMVAFRYYYPDSLFACWGLVALGSATALLGRDRIRLGDPLLWLGALALALCDSTRLETPVLLAIQASWALLIALRLPGADFRRRLREAALVFAIPAAALVATQTAIKWMNYRSFGVYALAVHTAPGLSALMGALYRIDTPDPSYYAPVTTQSLRAACKASPTLAAYEAKLLDPNNPATLTGQQYTGRPGEVGSWLNWLLMKSIEGKDVAETDGIMQRAADELTAAMRAGRLASRTAYYPVDPNFAIWLPHVPAKLAKLAGQLVRIAEWQPDSDDSSLAVDEFAGRSADSRMFDRAANRRSLASRPRVVSVRAAAFSDVGAIDLVSLEDCDGRVLAAATPALPAKASDGHVAERASFDLTADFSGDFKTARLGFWRGGARLGSVALNAVRFGTSEVALEGSSERVVLDLKKREYFDARRAYQGRQDFKRLVTRIYLPALLVACCLVAVSFATGASTATTRRLLFASAIVASAIVVRVLFFTVLIAMMSWAQPRYIQSFSPFLVPMMLTVSAAAGAYARRWLKSERTVRAPARSDAL